MNGLPAAPRFGLGRRAVRSTAERDWRLMARSNSAPRLRVVPSSFSVARSARRKSSVVDQVRQALRPDSRLAAVLGGLLGAFVPVVAYRVAHAEYDATRGVLQVPSLLVAACLLFSANSVYAWCRQAFGGWPKALGFVVLTEGVLLFSTTPWLTWAALAYLVFINGVSTACNLARGQ